MSSKKAWIMMGLLVLVVGVNTCAAPVAAECDDCSPIWIDEIRLRPHQYAEISVRSRVDPATNGFLFLADYEGDFLDYEGWAPGTLTRNSLITVSDPIDAECYVEEGGHIPNCEEISIAIADLSGISGEGSLIRLNFSVSDLGMEGMILRSRTQTRNQNTQVCDCEDGFPIIVGNSLGDCDGNGIINSYDALLLLRVVNNEINDIPEGVTYSCDMDGNWRWDFIDVLEILRQAAASTTHHVRAADEKIGRTGPGQISAGTPTPTGTLTKSVNKTAIAPICAKGYTLCKSRCVNLATDSTNCGSCGKACTTGQACSAGKCVISLRK